jgi:hypothetical protein
VNGFRVPSFSKLLFHNFAGNVIDNGMHSGVLLEASLNLLVFDLLGNFSDKIVLVFQELIQVTLLVALFNRVYCRLESTTFEVSVSIFSLHLLDFAFTLVVEFVNTTSELFLIQSILE